LRVRSNADGDDEPTIVTATVVVRKRIERFATRRPGYEPGAIEARLDEAGACPDPVRHQRTADMGPFAGTLTLEERGDDRTIERQRRRMIAHPGNRSGRQAPRVRSHL